MKRCPECRRDYYDDSLSYCLDDGSALLEGPASIEEPATAILSEPPALAGGMTSSESATRAQFRDTDPEAQPPGVFRDSTERHSHSANRAAEPRVEHPYARRLAKPLMAMVAAAVLLAGGFFGYRYFGQSRQIESIAVMPFVSDNGNADVEYLTDGMTETLIKSLSGLPGLDVKPRSAVFRYKGKDTDLPTIGRELNVQAILNGRVAQRGDQLTLSLELVDVKKNSVIWTEQYQRKQSDLVSLQSEIGRDVLTKLKAKLSGAEQTQVTKTATTDPEAYQAYLKGRFYWNRRTAENIKKAMEQFRIATDRDPNYALAFVGLADCYAVSSEYAGLPSSETQPKARTYAERALAIDPSLSEAHTTLGAIADFEWRWEDSEREFKRAIELNPNYATTYHWYSILLRNLGRLDESAAAIKRASELDPLSPVIAVNVSRIYQAQNDHDASIANSLRIIEMDPNFGSAYEYLALSYLAKGRTDEAIANALKSVELSNRSAITLGDLGYIYGLTGHKPEALSLVHELEDKYVRHEAVGIDMAIIWLGLGDRDKAFEWLERDFQVRDGRLPVMSWVMETASIRDDPRYKDLLRRMGLSK